MMIIIINSANIQKRDSALRNLNIIFYNNIFNPSTRKVMVCKYAHFQTVYLYKYDCVLDYTFCSRQNAENDFIYAKIIYISIINI